MDLSAYTWQQFAHTFTAAKANADAPTTDVLLVMTSSDCTRPAPMHPPAVPSVNSSFARFRLYSLPCVHVYSRSHVTEMRARVCL